MSDQARTLLLTGFPTSPIAAQVLFRLFETQPSWRFRCIVSAACMDQASTALHQRLGDASPARLQLLEGDVSSMDFGLAGKDYMRLAREVQQHHHCMLGAFAGEEPQLVERRLVAAAREVVEFAQAATQLRSIVHWSPSLTAAVRRGSITEAVPGDAEGFKPERVLQQGSGSHPLITLRSAHVVGDSQSGEVDRIVGPYLLISLLMHAPPDARVPMPGREDALLHVAPIDYVVAGGLAIADACADRSATYHLVDPDPVTMRQACQLIADALGRPAPRTFLPAPAELMSSLLRMPRLARFAYQPRVLLEQLANRVHLDASQARALLAPLGIDCPPFGSYVAGMVDAVQRVRNEPLSSTFVSQGATDA